MKNTTHSFSTKNESDETAVQELKAYARKTGKSFSWLVLQALKDYKLGETKHG